MTEPSTTCPRCGAALRSGTLEGLCAVCVQRVALLEASGVEEPPFSVESPPAQEEVKKTAGWWQPPSLEEMQAMLPQFEFVTLLGRGGMGAVYKARQTRLDRLVAVKMLPRELLDDGDVNFVERFRNEARTLARMNHPAIVALYEFGETAAGWLYIVMEYVDGTDVARLVVRKKCLPPYHALAITAGICDALEYAHSHGVIHRDIKPANILISRQGAVKVADFGLAKVLGSAQSDMTRSNMILGSPDFLAPEAMTPGIPLDSRADLYAVGVTLYQMLTGEIPRGMWMMPGGLPGIDPRFDFVVGRAMQKDRRLRYQKASEIRKDLHVIMTTPLLRQHESLAVHAVMEVTEERMEQAAESKTGSVPQVKVEITPRPIRRGRWKWPALASGLSLMLVGGLLVFSGKAPGPASDVPSMIALPEKTRAAGPSTSPATYELPVDRIYPTPAQLISLHLVANTGALACRTENGIHPRAKPGDHVVEWHHLSQSSSSVAMQSYRYSSDYSPVCSLWPAQPEGSGVKRDRLCLDFCLRDGIPSIMSMGGMGGWLHSRAYPSHQKDADAYEAGVTMIILFQAHASDLPGKVCTLSNGNGDVLSLCVDEQHQLILEASGKFGNVTLMSSGLDASLPCIAGCSWGGDRLLLLARNTKRQIFSHSTPCMGKPGPFDQLEIGRVKHNRAASIARSDVFSGWISEIVIFSKVIKPDQLSMNEAQLADYYFKPPGSLPPFKIPASQ